MCSACGWVNLMDDIDDMIVEDRYQYALDTLEGIYETVSQNECCTDRQKEAVENIRRAGNRER